LDPDHLRDLFAAFGPVTPRRMFSGFGVFADDVMFALVVRDVIYLKTDALTVPDFEREGSSPFSYQRRTGLGVLTSLWRLPERLYDDPEELAEWARRAHEAARRAAGKRKTTPARDAKRAGTSRPVRRPSAGPTTRTRGRPRK
jgi:DNA transformation protein